VLLDGAHLVRDALESRLSFEGAIVTSDKVGGSAEEGLLAEALAARGVDVAVADARTFDAASPTRQPSGIVAIAARRPTTAADLSAADHAFVVVTHELQDPGNVGAVIRSAEAGGADGVVVTAGSANPFSWKSLRGSMGSALRLPVWFGVDAAAVMDTLDRSGFTSVAAIARGGDDPDTLDWRRKAALWIGGEGQGLPTALVRRCAHRVAIPMAPPVESLNAAVAAGVLVYIARRHRT
jgi:TrmH family RNA methyltransferase